MPQDDGRNVAPSGQSGAGNRELSLGGGPVSSDRVVRLVDNVVSLADRRPPSDAAMSVYSLQRSLVKSRITLRTLLRHADAGGRRGTDAIWRSVSLTARLMRLQADVDRLLVSCAHSIWRIEGGLPPTTTGERLWIADARHEARQVISELNALTQHELETHYAPSLPRGIPYLEPIPAP